MKLSLASFKSLHAFYRDTMASKHLLLVFNVVLAASAFALCAHGGITSSYRRELEATADMPLDADVFRVPPGYNAPQQASHPHHDRFISHSFLDHFQCVLSLNECEVVDALYITCHLCCNWDRF